MGLLGDEVVKLFLGHDTVSIGVGTLDHLLKHSIVGQFSQIFGNLSEILESDKA